MSNAARPPSPLVALPSDVRRHILLHLPLSSRSALRCCSQSLRQAVNSFDRNLLLGGNEGSGDAARAASRRELVGIVEGERWVSKTQNANGDAIPGPCRLRRLAAGDHASEPHDHGRHKDRGPCLRHNGHYSDARLVDGRLWVLYNEHDCLFDVFDLDTGRGVEFYGAGRGPNKYYFSSSHEPWMASLELAACDGRHGMLAGGMELRTRKKPHGAWSGPYLTVWDIATDTVIVSVDLYRPLSSIVDVNVVSKERVAVLLAGADGVELQWHKIPQKRADWHTEGTPPVPTPDPPGDEPPLHECTFECPTFRSCPKKKRVGVWRGKKEFWEEQRRAQCRDDCNEGLKPSYESRCEYNWWPAQTTMLQSNVLRGTPLEQRNNATMASDGNGMVVILVAHLVQVWHVGTMTLLRECHPYDEHNTLDYSEGIWADGLSMHTVVHPIDDVLGQGEGAYCSSSSRQNVPQLRRSGRAQGSKNPIDLTSCDSLALLARFTHLTYDEQRSFERDNNLRVVFAIQNEDDPRRNRIMHMDTNCFRHIRHRESLQMYWDDREIEENRERYKHSLEGRSWWVDESTHFIPDDGEESGGAASPCAGLAAWGSVRFRRWAFL